MAIFESFKQRFDAHQAESMSLQAYLDLCREDASIYGSTVKS